MAELVANTGVNDPSTPWGSGLLNTVQQWGGVAGGLYNTFTGRNPAPNPAPSSGNATPAAPTPPAAPAWQKYLPVLLGALALAAVVFMIRRK